MINLESAFTLAELPQLVIFTDRQRANGFYVFPRRPRVATSDGRPQLDLMVYGRKEGGAFRATGAIASLTTTLAITDEEDRALRAALSRRLAQRMSPEPERAPVVDLLGADLSEARVAVRLTRDVTLTGRPSQFGGCPCTFQLKLDAARAQAVTAAWRDGLPESAIRYELELPIAGSASTEVRASEETTRTEASRETRASLEWSVSRTESGSALMVFEGPVAAPVGALTDLVSSIEM